MVHLDTLLRLFTDNINKVSCRKTILGKIKISGVKTAIAIINPAIFI